MTVEVKLLNNGGVQTNTKTYTLGGYEAKQVNAFLDFVPAVTTTNSLLQAKVTSGSGKVILYGTQIAGTQDNPGSNDSAGFEMSFRSDLLGANGAGVSSLNGLVGNIALEAGANIMISQIGNVLTISSTASATAPPSTVFAHPTDAGKEIRYVALEGPVPESFRLVTSEQGLTVVLTPSGELATLACARKSLDEIVVRSSADVEFDYVVNGVRKGHEGFEPIVERAHGPDRAD